MPRLSAHTALLQPLRPVVVAGLLLAAAACTVIPTHPGADKVVVSEAGKVAACEAKGGTTVGVLHQVAGIPRLPEVVAEDLERVASNDAVDMGGDTIVPQGPVAEGKRKFAIYKCRRDDTLLVKPAAKADVKADPKAEQKPAAEK